MPRKKSTSGKKDRPSKKTPAESVLPGVNPVVEDHATPSESLPFPIVAVGASAGGLEACNALLRAVPPDTGMAFVVVQHLSPTHESLLSEILQRSTKMPVAQVSDDMEVKKDHVYVIPPGKDLALSDGQLVLAPRFETRGSSRPIDHFMRSIAEEHGYKSIGIVLSGTANDGSLGIQEIKAAGGITFAQDSTAEQSSMPRSAVATGAVDFVLPPEAIGRELARIAQHPYVDPDESAVTIDEAAFRRIVGILRHATGVDFDGYKRNTLNRRIRRRMLLHRFGNLQDYLRFLQGNTAEIEALYQDVLINVTSFFRNPEAYEALKKEVFPKITADRSHHDPVRIWALGCSTGEEAYSIAMAFTEFAEASGKHVPAQIFATDLNATGIDRARNGVYTKSIAEDVSAERLRRFFVEVDGSYRVAKPIRDMCVFARQNVLADPPFSRLDLVACRNLLIYLDGPLQQRVVPMLHYALRPNGFLWLGGSETIGTYREMFEVIDAHHKIYEKKKAALRPPALQVPKGAARWDPARGATHASVPALHLQHTTEPQREAERLLLQRYAPPAVVVNEDFDILHFRGDTGPFLVPAPGRASLNLLKMLREGLIVAVRGALTRARRDGKAVREENLRVRTSDGWRELAIEVSPIKPPNQAASTYLVIFEEPQASLAARTRKLYAAAEEDASRAEQAAVNPDAREIARLKQELGVTREYLQSVIEQQEAANEELQSANEEVQSANEELQSINEELETSKEEIQSSNEELATVNDELQSRNLELSQSNNDLMNLVQSVQLAILMVGRDLRVRRFTPAAETLFNLMPGDLGRPLGDVKSALNLGDLEQVVLDVIQTMSVREREVQDRSGRWYSLRVRPYRTQENVIEGAVIALLDIDDLKKAERALNESEERFEALADSAPVLIWLTDGEGLRFVNRAFEDFVGELEGELRKSTLARFAHPDDRAGLENDYQEAVRARRPFESRARMRRSDGAYRWMKTVGMPRFRSGGELMGYVGGSFDITDMKEAEAALLELDRGKNEFLAVLAHELRNPLSGVRNASRLLTDASDPRIVAQARDIIERQAVNMVRMIDDLLDVSRITHGKINLQRESVDLAALVRHAVDAGAHQREAGPQSLTLRVPETPVWVSADPLRLDQVVTNLLSNAMKFTRADGKIWVTLEREMKNPQAGPVAVLSVRDNGIGIPPRMLPRVFDLFVQGDRAAERTRAGMGLGLTLAKRLVELHDGTIEAYSAGEGLGSEFVVRLAALEESQARARPPAQRPGTGRRYRLLIVDDNVDSAESLRLLLTMAGHEVSVVHDGSGVASSVGSFKPDAVLLDIGLPDRDGYEVARELRADPKLRDLLIVAVTGYGRREDILRGRDAGIDAHLTKPIDPARLMAIIGGRDRGGGDT